MLMTQEDYVKFRDLLGERTGLFFPDNRRKDLIHGLEKAVQAQGDSSISQYYVRLYGSSPEEPIWEDLVARLTIGETYFFRNSTHTDALVNHILPPLIESRRLQKMQILRIWSAGCATGEEPYTLAIILREMIPDIQDWNISILATDINRKSLAQAASGIYRQHSFRSETPPHIRERYFSMIHNSWELKPAIRQMVHFSYLNLVEDSYPSPGSLTIGQDIIVCRNVTIYFSPQVTRNVVGRFNRAIRDDGWLIVGPAEPQVNFYETLGFQARNLAGAVLYQKSKIPENVSKAPAPQRISQPVAPVMEPAAISIPANSLRELAPAPLQAAAETNPIQTHLDEASQCANQMQWAQALEHLDSVLKLEPMCSEAYFLRSLIYQHQGDNRAAVEAIKRTLYLDRRFVLGYFNLGMIHWQEGLVAEARKAWKLAHELVVALPPDAILPQGDGMRAGRLLSVLDGYLNQEAVV